MKLSFFILALSLAACGGLTELELDEVAQPFGSRQGTEILALDFNQQNQQIESFRLSPMMFGGAVLGTVRVENGELIEENFSSAWIPPLDVCAAPTAGLRECGWRRAATANCAPNRRIAVGAGARGLGVATIDPMIRVCAGLGACWGAQALAQNDDDIGTNRSYAEFNCPAAGRFTVLVASHFSSDPIQATPGARMLLPQQPLALDPWYARRATGFTNVTLQARTNGGFNVPIRIGTIIPDQNPPNRPNGGRSYLYQVLRPDGAGGWTSLCRDDAQQSLLAIPLADSYDAGGGAQQIAGQFSFACSDGVAFKCARDWGYQPWLVFDPLDRDRTLELHRSCTRLGRADYCGDGRTFTMNGTDIDLWDAETPQINAADPAFQQDKGLQFEAGWNEAGAVCLSHARWLQLGVPQICGENDLPLNPQDNTCNTEQEAVLLGANLFDASAINSIPVP